MRSLLFLAALLVSPAAARDLRPSVGVSYSETDLDSPTTDTQNAIQGWHLHNYSLDVLYPTKKDIDFLFAVSRTFLTVDSWTRTYQLNSVTTSPSGGVIGVYGENGAFKRRETLDGYTVSLGARFYLKP